MNSENINEDNYLNSIKKFFIPFIILNLIAIVLGASAVNILQIVIRSNADTNSGIFTSILARDSLTVEIAEIPPIQAEPDSILQSYDASHTFSESQTKLSEANASSSQTYLTTIGASSIQEPPPIKPTAYPKPNSIPEKQFQYDQVTEATKGDSKPLSTSRLSINDQSKDSSAIEIKREPEVRHLILPTLNVKSEVFDIPIINGNWDISQIDGDSGILDGFANDPTDSEALVIAAHATTNWPTAGPFAKLRTMSLGDPIIFQLGTTEYVYEISRFLRVSTADVSILKKNGESGIVLVTCGSYNYFTGEYGSRLVVYGDLIGTRETVAQTSN